MMNLLLPTPLALIGTWELVVILAALLIPLTLAAVGIGLVIWLVTRSKPTSPLPPVPPPGTVPDIPTATRGDPRCPRCGAPLGLRRPHGLCPKCALGAGFPSNPPDSSGAAGAADPPPVAELTAHFPELEIVELIGRGGMGWVYLARQNKLDRRIALKILPPESARDPAFAERFQREARALAQLNHPNIVTIYDFGQAGPYFYFVMEYVDGANLRQLERTRRLTPEEAFAIVPRICEALQYAHEEGIVHRDIKPENILIDRRQRVKIADFGLAKLIGRAPDVTLTGSQQALGTPHYMAPEQMESPTTVDHRADIYALGVVFYEMLTGELPLGRFEPPSQKLSVDVRLDEVVLKSLERSPDRRYQSARAVQTDVETIATGTGTVESADPATTGTPIRPATTLASGTQSTARRAAPGAFSLIHEAGRSWWADRSRWLLLSVQAILVMIHLVCLLGFFSARIVNQSEDGIRQFTFALGAGQPWFQFEGYPAPSTPFRTGIDPWAGSLWFLIAGFVVYYGVWRLEKVRNPRAGFWSTPPAMALLWGLFAAVAVVTGTVMGHRAVRESLAEQSRVPMELRGALLIQSNSERDQALRRVALDAAAGGTAETARQAVAAIRAHELHDRTAEECALALHRNRQPAEALSLARAIRTNSLRDATLAELAKSGVTNNSAVAAPKDLR